MDLSNNRRVFKYDGKYISVEVVYEVLNKFVENLCMDSEIIATRWISKQLDNLKNTSDNLCNLCYLVFTQEMRLSIKSGNISLYRDYDVLQIPAKHLGSETAQYIETLAKLSPLFFNTVKEKGFGDWDYSNFRFDQEINKSKLRYFIFCKILVTLVTLSQTNSLVYSYDLIPQILKTTVLRIKRETVQSIDTNEIKAPLASTALNFDKSLSSLGHLLKLSLDPLKLTNVLSNPQYLLSSVASFDNNKFIQYDKFPESKKKEEEH